MQQGGRGVEQDLEACSPSTNSEPTLKNKRYKLAGKISLVSLIFVLGAVFSLSFYFNEKIPRTRTSRARNLFQDLTVSNAKCIYTKNSVSVIGLPKVLNVWALQHGKQEVLDVENGKLLIETEHLKDKITLEFYSRYSNGNIVPSSAFGQVTCLQS